MKKRKKKKGFIDPREAARKAIERVSRLGKALGAHPRTDTVINPTFGTPLYRCDENDNPVRTQPDFWDILYAHPETEIQKARRERVAQIENNHKVKNA